MSDYETQAVQSTQDYATQYSVGENSIQGLDQDEQDSTAALYTWMQDQQDKMKGMTQDQAGLSQLMSETTPPASGRMKDSKYDYNEVCEKLSDLGISVTNAAPGASDYSQISNQSKEDETKQKPITESLTGQQLIQENLKIVDTIKDEQDKDREKEQKVKEEIESQ